jgi:MFS superfamily sulfate permease-like transporter
MPEMPLAWYNFCEALETTWLYRTMQITWIFPVVETFHHIGMVLLVGSITLFDLRLLGLAMKGQSVSQLADRLLPATWTAFALMIATGSLLFVTTPVTKYCPNPALHIKLALMFLAGLNMAVFHFTVYRRVGGWDQAHTTPLGAKLVGSFSVLLWAGVIAAGRWIGFT